MSENVRKSPLEPVQFQPPSYREVTASVSEEMAYAEKLSVDTARTIEQMDNGVDVVKAVLLGVAIYVKQLEGTSRGDVEEVSGYDSGINDAVELLQDPETAGDVIAGFYNAADQASKKIYGEHVQHLRSQHAIEEQDKAVKRFAAELGLDADNLTPEQEGLILQKVNLEIPTDEKPANNPDGSPGRLPMPEPYELL